MPSDSVTAKRSKPARQACAGALAEGQLAAAQAECLVMFDVLKAGFGE